jgi:hypothetical protein
VKFVFTGKESGNYKLVGIEVNFRLGGPFVIGDVHTRDGVVREVSLDED